MGTDTGEVAGLFKAWPFSVVPDPASPVVWAGRPNLRAQVEQYIGVLKLRPQSSVDIVWAAFGSGKTHFLLYLGQEVQARARGAAWYGVVPKVASNLGGFYQAIAKGIPIELLTKAVSVVDQRGELKGEFRDAFRALYMGSADQRATVGAWIRGQPINLRTARALVDVPFRLDGPQEILSLLTAVAQVMFMAGGRFILLLDEYQRVRTFKAPVRDAVGAMFLDLFNAVPRGVSLLLSCSATQQAVAFQSVPGELQDRMRGRRPFAIPAMSTEEGYEFAADLIRLHRPEGYAGAALAPFSKEGLRRALSKLSEPAGGHLTPRRLMQVLDNALSRVLMEERSEVTERDVERAVDEVDVEVEVAVEEQD